MALLVNSSTAHPPFGEAAMRRFTPFNISRHHSAALIAAILCLATISVANAWEDTPRLNIFHLAYPVAWNGRTVMIGARLQLPDGIKAKMPAVIILHGTGGIRYSGVYYAAALNRAGIATLEVDQWGGRGLTGAASNRPKGRGDMLPDVGAPTDCWPSGRTSMINALVLWA